MASLCKRQQCTIDRRGFRQELDSWRHKLIHCVGFESILEGLFGPELVQDLQLFKDREPLAVSDWSFDENCVFCCLRRDKVKEHLNSLNSEGLEDPPKPLLVKDQTLLIKLERQAEEFLSAVLRRKDVPNFSDPHVPVVAREILQRMIRQFAVEYTSKASAQPQDPPDSQPRSDQSLPSAQPLCSSPATSPLSSVHNLNPVLSKLLMIDQDAPLDLTIKKPLAEPTEQDGVLDLSIKKNRTGGFTPNRSSCLSPITLTPKGEPREMQISKVKELQAKSTLEHFLCKLCLHHQRQIVSAVRYLQAEVKALTPSKSSPVISAHELQRTCYSPVRPHSVTPTKTQSEPPKSHSKPEGRHNLSSCLKVKPSITPASSLDFSRASPVPVQTPVPPTTTATTEAKNSGQVDHAPLKLKIMKTGSVSAGNKLSCVLTTALSPQSVDDRQGNLSSHSIETPSARLSSSFKKREPSHTPPARQPMAHADERAAKPLSFHATSLSNAPRTARKSIRPPSEQNNDYNDRVILDPDLGHCDIVYINKPITECFKKRHRGLAPRRNARKSTRGHMYADDVWEIKTVRTLAGRGNFPNHLLEFNTSVTPKQNLSKPEGVPPVDMPCAGECTEAMGQQMTTQEPTESELPEVGQAVETTATDAEVIVETSQTDQSHLVEEAVCPSPAKDLDITEVSVEQEISAELKVPSETENIVANVSAEEEKGNAIDDTVQPVVLETVSESVEGSVVEQTDEQASSDNIEVGVEQNYTSSEVKEVPEEENVKDKIHDEITGESQTETNVDTERSVETERAIPEVQPAEVTVTKQETTIANTGTAPECKKYMHESDLSSKTLEDLSKELPPWRRKKGNIPSGPKLTENAEEVIVGFVSGMPVLASDRSLRRRSSQTVPPKEMPSKRSRKAQSNSDEKPNTESGNLDKPLAVEQELEPEKSDPSPSGPSVTEKSPDKPMIPEPKMSTSKSKVNRKKTVGQSTLSTRHLRSSGQVPVESPTVLPISASVTTAESVVSSQSLETESKLDTLISKESSPPPTMSLTLDQASSQIAESSMSPETIIKLKTDEQPAEPSKSQAQSNEYSPVQSKPNLRSSKIVPDDSKTEKVEIEQVTTTESPVKSEPQTQAMSLRSKRTLQNLSEPRKSSAPQKPIVEAQVESSACTDTSVPVSEKPTRMPLRSEGSKTEHSPPAEDKRLTLRSQRQTPVVNRPSEMSSPIRMIKMNAPSTSRGIVFTTKSEPPKQASVKFLEALNREDNQQLIANLNLKYDKMHKGWMQLDKEGQPTPKHRNKSDRQAAIWKSKRRSRKPKTMENPKYSPVQMLFMKGFDLSTICRWFLETTETKSLVIVKKVNTRLPSETQLCFHSSGAAGSSQGIYPSLQAERLKKHLKKFAIASPVKSNPKSQKLIAKALEQELTGVAKGKEKKEKDVASPSVKKVCSSTKRESPKPKSGKAQNPASARILRKYSNIREKMQVQHANARLKDKRKVKANLKSLSKGTSKSNLKPLKSTSPHVKKQVETVAKSDKKKTLVEKSNEEKSVKSPPKEKAAKAAGGQQVAKEEVKKELPKRTSQRLGSPPVLEPVVTVAPKNKPSEGSEPIVSVAAKNKADKKIEEKKAVETVKPTKAKAAKVQKESTEEAKGKSSDNPETNNSKDSKVPTSPDQVQTRSHSKSDATGSVSATPKSVSKKSAKIIKTIAEEPARTRSGALKQSAKRSQTATLPRSASKKAQELLETPAKRTRTK